MKSNLFKRIAASALAAALAAAPIATLAETVTPALSKAFTAVTLTETETQFKAPAGYNEHDYNKLRAFLEIKDENGVKNGEKISDSYDPDKPETWNGRIPSNPDDFGNFEWVDSDSGKRISVLQIGGRGLCGSLDLSDCTDLWIFHCGGNQLTELNVSGSCWLEDLTCDNNQLTKLNVSSHSEILWLDCRDNQLTELDLSNASIGAFFCTGNQFKELDLSNFWLDAERVVADGNGWIAFESSEVYIDDSYRDGTSVYKYTLTADPMPGYGFDGWYSTDGRLLSKNLELFCGYSDDRSNEYFDVPDFDTTEFIAKFSNEPVFNNGDIDGDGEVTTGDALATIRNAMGLQDMSAEQIAAADMDGDGEVTTSDALIIIRIAMGI